MLHNHRCVDASRPLYFLQQGQVPSFLPFFSVSLLGKVSYINVIATRAVEHVGGLSYPFVGDPL